MKNLRHSKDPENTRIEKKLAQIHALKEKLPQYRDMLDFFEPIVKEKEQYKADLSSALDRDPIDDPVYFALKFHEGLPFLQKDKIRFDDKITTAYFMKLIHILTSKNNTAFIDCLDYLDDLNVQDENFSFKALFNDFIHHKLPLPGNDLLAFAINETINPVLEIYAGHLKHHIKPGKWTEGFCPVCGEKPFLSSLTDDTGKRILICPACNTEWAFQRTKCPFCDNEDQQQLSYFFIENDERYRIEICEGCRQYLKTIDFRKAPRKVAGELFYDIEDIITLHLDIIAREKGYTNKACIQNNKKPLQ